jgi:hypothetical protein
MSCHLSGHTLVSNIEFCLSSWSGLASGVFRARVVLVLVGGGHILMLDWCLLYTAWDHSSRVMGTQ